MTGWAEQARAKRIKRAHGFRCHVCNTVHADAEAALEVDHVVPLAAGGNDTDDNLRPICLDCHERKTQAESRGVGYPD